MNSDGHLTINGNGDMNNGDELDNSSVDNVVAATGNYKFVSTTQQALALSLITKIKKLST
ncbi:outer membrane autotransporter [Escherichia coli]|uniref:Outer membrane autotransporter n=1 Tax=Escherichia coli TaxID=562 RepID=A0A376U4A7_ECOLX|nr:outer membrane autotransporter [Escherichia coli]